MLLVAAGVALAGCGALAPPPVDERLAADAAPAVEAGALFIDVRNAAERHSEGAPAGALSIPYAFPDSFVAAVERMAADRDARIVLICRAGVTSRAAAEALALRGYTRVLSIADGFSGGSAGPGWKAWGLPLQ